MDPFTLVFNDFVWGPVMDGRGLHNLTVYVAAISAGIKIDWWIWLYDPAGTVSRVDPAVDQYYLGTASPTGTPAQLDYGLAVWPGTPPLNDSFLGPSMFRLGAMQIFGGHPGATARIVHACATACL